MRPSAVVVLDVFGKHGVQMPLAQDQHAVGEFGSDGAHRDGVERGRELANPITDKEPELLDPVTEVHHEGVDLLGSPRTVRIGCRAEEVDVAAADFQHELAGGPAVWQRMDDPLPTWEDLDTHHHAMPH
ncbi:hypothetical protein [Kutzneria chonburiensis]|uniref:Uncharacterized protein n=1 Tax=Kutzneria chonburiensis TaxID=1483604 RepID=A0ABV6MNP9_9PSEU